MANLVLGVLKTALIIVVFILGSVSVVYTQFVGILISFNNEFLAAWIANTKEYFIVLLVTILNFASKSPIKLRIISPSIPPSKLRLDPQTRELFPIFAPNTVIIANHQLYTDWVFLWWLSYTANLGKFVYIILKASLRKLPILGWGMINYDFIFVSRKWLKDKITMGKQLDRIDANARGAGPTTGATLNADGEWPKGFVKGKKWPYSLILFPEGTNLSDNTRSRSDTYAAKIGKSPFKNLLLPRITGLRFSLLKLKNTVHEVYDVTLGYSGVKQEEYGQDIYTLGKVFLKGENPERVEFYIRSYKIDEIPIGKLDETEEEAVLSNKEFEDWLFKVWGEKDKLLDTFYETGSFVGDSALDEKLTVVDTKLSVSKSEFFRIFSVPLITYFFAKNIWKAVKWFT